MSPVFCALLFAIYISSTVTVDDKSLVIVAVTVVDTLKDDMIFSDKNLSSMLNLLPSDFSLKFSGPCNSEFSSIFIRHRYRQLHSILLVVHETQVRVSTSLKLSKAFLCVFNELVINFILFHLTDDMRLSKIIIILIFLLSTNSATHFV